MGSWGKWAQDLRRLTATHPNAETRFSTLFDLYGLPEDFPGLGPAERLPRRTERATELEAAMGAAIGDWRLIPYIQVHEFEALVLAALPALRLLLEGPGRLGLDTLEKEIEGLAPESVNDGPDMAPSKRLLRLPTYSKTFHGPQAIAETGLAALRAACPRFSGWVDRLEACSLSPGSSTPSYL